MSSLSDPDVVNYFDDEKDEEEVRRALRVGIQALRPADMAKEVDFVEKRFNELRQRFGDKLESFEEKIDNTFADENATVPQILAAIWITLRKLLTTNLVKTASSSENP